MNRICVSFVKKKVSKCCICIFCSLVKLNEISKFWALNCTKMHLAAGLRRTRWGSYSAPPDPLAVMGRERKGIGMKGRGREGKGGKGDREGRGEGKWNERG